MFYITVLISWNFVRQINKDYIEQQLGILQFGHSVLIEELGVTLNFVNKIIVNLVYRCFSVR